MIILIKSNILLTYVVMANLNLNTTEPFFRCLHYCKSTNRYKLRSTGMSYTRTREIVLEAFVRLGYPKEKFGLHSLRSGGATAAANAGVKDCLFKRHGRWKSENAKDGYVKDKLESLLLVSRSLHAGNSLFIERLQEHYSISCITCCLFFLYQSTPGMNK